VFLSATAGYIGTIGGVESGTAFPGSPDTNDRYFRTDRGIEYYYDGTRWLSTQLFLDNWSFTSITASTSLYSALPSSNPQDIWLEDVYATCFKTAAGQWNVAVRSTDAANANTTLATITNAVVATSTWEYTTAALNMLVPVGGKLIDISVLEISGTSTLFAAIKLSYRLVG
jgi:mRNA-degrading endonuclease toxin of MazEF toxin-antitoxin module